MNDRVPFFITGLPRSRTAWLANLLTTEKTHCLHDGLADFPSVDAFLSHMAQPSARIRGDSDSTLLLFHERVAAAFPDSKWVFVNRDPAESFKSLKLFWAGRMEFSTDVFSQVRAFRDKFLRSGIAYLEADFDSLSQTENVRAIWSHCLPGIPMDADRCELLQKFRINTTASPDHGAHLGLELPGQLSAAN